MKYFILVVSFVFGVYSCNNKKTANKKQFDSKVEIGLIADCQYANQPNSNVRHYRSSLKKLKQSVDTFNSMELDHVFVLGDFIDKRIESFDSVNPIINQLKSPYSMLLGNHDFSVPDSLKMEVPSKLGLGKRYFNKRIGNWNFIILDGNDISLYAYPENSEKHKAAVEIYNSKYTGSPTYNGAVGQVQMEWLKDELINSQEQKENVAILCHFPVLPMEGHALWNSLEILDLIANYNCVKAWINGHNHAGAYEQKNGVHFLTLKGMVDTEQNAFAKIIFDNEKMILKGYGRQEGKILKFNNKENKKL